MKWEYVRVISPSKANVIVRSLGILATLVGLFFLGCGGYSAYTFVVNGREASAFIPGAILFLSIGGWFTHRAYRSWVGASPAIIRDVVASLGVSMMLAPIPFHMRVAMNGHSLLDITESPVMSLVIPMSLYFGLLFVAIWICESLTASLNKSLFPNTDHPREPDDPANES